MRLRDQHRVQESEEGMTLRDCAARIFPHLPKKAVRKAIHRGQITLDGTMVPSNTLVKSGQEISLWEETVTGPTFEFRLDVIHDDDSVLVINKPAGLLVSGNVHRTVQRALAAGSNTSTLHDALDVPRPVHRLDRNTSGVLVIARTASALRHLSHQFANRTVEKEYHAIVLGKLEAEMHLIEPVDGKPAETVVAPIRQMTITGESFTLVRARPLTGRRHQIRVHLAGIGHPVAGDSLYGGTTGRFSRLMLHAIRVRLAHPTTEEHMLFESTLPGSFRLPAIVD